MKATKSRSSYGLHLSPPGLKIQRRTFLATGVTGLAWAAMHGAAAASNTRTRFVISVSGPVDGPIAKGWGELTAEFQKRGFPTTFVSVINLYGQRDARRADRRGAQGCE